MSKKKNTLQDLDDFLKQQAATLVTPASLDTPAGTSNTLTPAETKRQSEVVNEGEQSDALGSPHDPAFRTKLYNFIIQSLEQQKESLPADKMLINTALYLKGGNDWKNVIREYWRRIII